MKGAISYENISGVILVVLMVKTPRNFARIPSPEGSRFHPYIQHITRNITDEGVIHDRLAKIYYAELDECLKQYEAGVNLCGDTELQFILSAICDANSSKVTQEFIDGKHTDIYNELKQMVLDKEACLTCSSILSFCTPIVLHPNQLLLFSTNLFRYTANNGVSK